MKLIYPLFIAFVLVSCSKKATNYIDEIKLYQYLQNVNFADAKHSPLNKEDLKVFKSLDFFPINKKYQVVATLELTPEEPIFEMKTTTSELQLYRKYGKAHFSIDGLKMELSLYQSQDLINSPQYKDLLFLPFNDLTNGKTSYGGGRYIDIEIPSKNDKSLIIDFNKAYNPYCAYNKKFSCPVPPSENSLPIAINAGVKAFKKAH